MIFDLVHPCFYRSDKLFPMVLTVRDEKDGQRGVEFISCFQIQFLRKTEYIRVAYINSIEKGEH